MYPSHGENAARRLAPFSSSSRKATEATRGLPALVFSSSLSHRNGTHFIGGTQFFALNILQVRCLECLFSVFLLSDSLFLGRINPLPSQETERDLHTPENP